MESSNVGFGPGPNCKKEGKQRPSAYASTNKTETRTRELSTLQKIQEEESHKTADPIQEQKEMINSISGKAVFAVQRIIQLVNDAKKEFPLSAHQLDSVATDDMVYMTERILEKQQEFLKNGIPSYIDVGYHYTHPDNMRKIRSNGLLTQAERKAKSIHSRNHGPVFGDGIYTASFAHYGEQGLLVARLIGNSVRVPKSLSCLTSSNYLDIAKSSITIITRLCEASNRVSSNFNPLLLSAIFQQIGAKVSLSRR